MPVEQEAVDPPTYPDDLKADFSTYEELGKTRNRVKELEASLVGSRFEVEAAKAGVDISTLQPYINMNVFSAEDGSPDVDKIQDFISLLGATAGKPEFTQDVFAGDGGSGVYRGPRTDRPESFRGMSRAQIAEFAKRNR
ncbi:hypothetical protein [Streptosporangium sp. NPDC002524]|uniref:hypothetical protein n=1 Tax=Streptosporangium sp. NPDC002524 TaxID=3154537 RepID=UPI00332C0FBB